MMRTTGPGRLARLSGTVAVLVGVLTIMANLDTYGGEPALYVAWLLVIGGLLLRIEGAVTAAAQRRSEFRDRSSDSSRLVG